MSFLTDLHFGLNSRLAFMREQVLHDAYVFVEEFLQHGTVGFYADFAALTARHKVIFCLDQLTIECHNIFGNCFSILNRLL